MKLNRGLFILFLIVSLLSAQFAYAAFYDDSSRYIQVSRRATEDLHGESRSFFLDKYSVRVMAGDSDIAVLDLDSVYVSTAWQPFGIGTAVFHSRYYYNKSSGQCWFVYLSADALDENGEILIDEDGKSYADFPFEGKGQVHEALPRSPSGWIGNIAYQIAFNQRFR